MDHATLKRQWLAATLAGLLPVASALAQGNDVLHVYNWSDYIDESLLAEFEAETGIRVVYDVFDSNEVLETKLLAGSSGYDVVVPTASFLVRQIQAGVFQELDDSRLPNRANMWPAVSDRVGRYEGDVNRYSVNYMWGTTGIGYNAAKILERMSDAPVESWAMIFDPAVVSRFADCGVHVLDAPDELIPAALNYLGLDPSSGDRGDIERAEALLLEVRPHIQKFHSSEYINALANGDICLAVGWSGDVLQARDRADETGSGIVIEYVIPEEGAQMWFDQLAIPADAPHVDNAYTFIDFLMRPEVIAQATNYVNYANGNLASREFVDPEILDDPGVYPPDEVMERLYTKGPYDPATQRIVTRIWTRVKTGR